MPVCRNLSMQSSKKERKIHKHKDRLKEIGQVDPYYSERKNCRNADIFCSKKS